MNSQLEPLPGDVAHLLSRGATQLEPSAHTRRRLRERLSGEGRGQGGTVLALAPRPSLGGLVSSVIGSRLLIGLSSFALGVGATSILGSTGFRPAAMPGASASVVTALDSPPQALVLAPQIAASSSLAPVNHPRHVARAAGSVRPRSPVASPGALESPKSGTLKSEAPKSDLGLEGELLERGRIAMVRGDAEGALEAADEHALRFPAGRLNEEREALRVQALVTDGRLPEARIALSAFRGAHPRSLVGPALEAAVAGR